VLLQYFYTTLQITRLTSNTINFTILQTKSAAEPMNGGVASSIRNSNHFFLNFLLWPINTQLYHKIIYHSSLFVWSTLLFVSTLSCHHQTVYNQSFARLHMFFKLQLLENIKLIYFLWSLFKFSDCSCWNHNFI